MNLDEYEVFYTDTGTVYIRKDEVVHSTPSLIPPKVPQNGANEPRTGIRWDLMASRCQQLVNKL